MTGETAEPMTRKQISDRLHEIAPWPDSDPTPEAVARWLAVHAQREWAAHIIPFTTPGGPDALDVTAVAKLNAQFAAAHALLALIGTGREAQVAREISLAWSGAATGIWIWEHLKDLGVDPDEVTRLEQARMALDKADPGEVADALHATLSRIAAERGPDAQPATPPAKVDPMFEQAYMDVQKVLDKALGAEEEDGTGGGIASEVWLLAHQRDGARAERDRLQSGAITLGRVVIAQARSMQAARIEMLQNGPEAAMEWILNSIPDVDDNEPEDQWDGKESARKWFDRTEAGSRELVTDPGDGDSPAARAVADAERLEAAAAVLDRRYPATRPDELDHIISSLLSLGRTWRRMAAGAEAETGARS